MIKLFHDIFFFVSNEHGLVGSSDCALHSLCCDIDKRKTQTTQKELIEKHIYSSNRNKIQVNLVKQ